MVEPGLGRFGERYELAATDAMIAVERDALGSDYGANGYTSRDQADEILARLRLGPDATLLDLGSGCGWPGLYLARRAGCRLVSVDPVEVGVRRSASRGRADGLAGRHLAVLGDGTRLPLGPRSVDGLVHVDVLC